MTNSQIYKNSPELFDLFMLLMLHVNVLYGSHLHVSRDPLSTTINITDPLLIRCEIEGSEAVNISWRWTEKHDYEIADSFDITQTSNQVSITPMVFESSSALNWKEGIDSQTKKSANGTVVAYTTHHGNMLESRNATLVVQWPPTTANITQTSPVTIIRMKELVLNCFSKDPGYPPGVVKWTKGGILQPAHDGEEPLTINQATESHTGNWSCSFENLIGHSSPSEIVNVTVIWQPGTPTLTLEPGVSHVAIGQKAMLTCKLTDKGNPTGQIVWLKDNTEQIGSEYAGETVEFFVDQGHNESKWCCYYNNSIGKGPTSGCRILYVTATIPKPGVLTVTSKTATSLNISIDNSEIDLNTYKLMNVSWRSNTSMEVFHDIVKSFLNYKLLIDLEPATNYLIQFAFIYNDESGQTREISDSTESAIVSNDPSITREWLFAKCTLKLTGTSSDTRVVCEVCRPDGTDCIKEMKTFPAKQVTKRSIAEKEVIIKVKDSSFSRRLVNVTVYDTGVLVYDYSGNIDAPVAAIVLIVLGAILIVAAIIIIIVIIIKKTGKKKPRKEVEEEISPYGHANPTMTNQSRTGTGHETKAGNALPVTSVVNKGKLLAPIAASPADGDVYSQVDWSKKTKRPSLKGLPMSTKAIDKITFSKTDGSINMHLEVRKKFTGQIEINVCREGDQSSKCKESKQHVGGTNNVNMVLPIEETSQDKYTIRMKFIAKGQMVQEVDLTYPYEQNAVNVTVMNDAYVTSGTDAKASEMPEYSEVNKSKKTKGSEMPIYSEVNKPKKKKKAAEEQPYEDVETKNQSSHNERSTNAVSPSNAEVAVEGVPAHPPRKGAPKEGVMYAELDLNSSGAPRLLPRLGSKSPAQEPVIYADVRPGQNDVV